MKEKDEKIKDWLSGIDRVINTGDSLVDEFDEVISTIGPSNRLIEEIKEDGSLQQDEYRDILFFADKINKEVNNNINKRVRSCKRELRKKITKPRLNGAVKLKRTKKL